jgi:TRAP-type C4-dicarboxylate transport system permease small subunit
MKNAALILLVLLYWALHQDFWNWRAAEPLAFGFLPIGLTYHALYTLGVSLLMAFLVKVAWPVRLEKDAEVAPQEEPTKR